jgi:hypothetical protein
MSEPISFDKPDYDEGVGATGCTSCRQPLGDVYWTLNGHVACTRCKEQAEAWHAGGGSSVARVFKAIALGSLGGIVGAAIWYLIAHYAHLTIGFVAILVGWLVGSGVRKGSGYRGGLGYQLLAVGLTYLSIAASQYPEVVAGLSEGDRAMNRVLACVVALPLCLISPFFMNIISIAIAAFGLFEAWRINRPHAVAITGPHALHVEERETSQPEILASEPPPLA